MDHLTSGSDVASVIRAAANGDEEAFVVLWRSYQPRLLRFLNPLVPPDDTADLASTVWVDVVRRLDRFTGGEAEFRAWLFTLARRRAIDLYRNRSRRREDLWAEIDESVAAAALGDPEFELDNRESTEAILELIGTLPRSEAEVVLLRVVADLDVATIAGIVGKRAGTVRVLSHRGIERLRDALTAQQPSRTASSRCR